MPGSNSWALEAIEKEAMKRAREEQLRFPSTFTFMGFSPRQLTVIICHAIREHDIDSRMPAEELAMKLK